jgi:N-acetylglucosamine-6-phosphate deacetylase
MLYFHSPNLITPLETIPDGALLVENGCITALGPQASLPPPPDAQVIDAHDLLLAPGLIDLQLNGGFGLDFTADPGTIWQVGAQLPQYGVTAFLPTIITSPLETVAHAQEVLRLGPLPSYRGASPLGLHIEGPFLNPQKRGAHNLSYLRPPDLAIASEWRLDKCVRLVTLAPELPGALELIRVLNQQGVVVSAGHSLASLNEALAAFEAGVRYGTHLFNAMPPLDHRQPGLVAALLSDPRITPGLIPDGIHVHPAMVAMVWRLTGPGRLSLVTDAMAALGMPPGRYLLNDLEVIVDETTARLSDGRLAGSLLSLDQAVRNLIAFTSCTPSEALATVSLTPSLLLGMENERGRLSIGSRADVTLLTPDLHVAATYIGGELAFCSEEFHSRLGV